MQHQCVIIDNVTNHRLRAAVEAVQEPGADPDAGHRTRPGLSPRLASLELRTRSGISRAVIINSAAGAVLAVRYQPGAKETWEGVACRGYPQDEHYRQAYTELFKREPLDPPAARMRVLNPPEIGPRDPRPQRDGWAVSVWFYDSWKRTTAKATRLIVRS